MVENVLIEFLDHKNVGIDTKIVFLCDLVFEILSIFDFMAAILNLGYQKFSSRVPKWHPAEFGSGWVQYVISAIKLCPDPKTRLTRKTLFGSWTTLEKNIH